MSYKRKYKMGSRIRSLNELVKQDWVYLFPTPKGIRNIGVIESMTLKTVEGFLSRGMYKAIPTDDTTIIDIQHVGYDEEQCGRTK